MILSVVLHITFANLVTRDMRGKTYGRTDACFLGITLGVEPVTKPEHAAYIKYWLVLNTNWRL